MKDSKIFVSTEFDNKNIVINIPVDLLVFTQEMRDNAYSITNVEDMINSFIKNFIDYDEDDSGNTPLYNAIDGFFDWAYESGENWLEYTDNFENEDE